MRDTRIAQGPSVATAVSSRTLNNRILLRLPAAERARVLAHAMEVELRPGQVLFHPGEPVRHYYFVNRGLISLLLGMSDGRSIEIGARGVEAITMPETLFGPDSANFESVVQLPGSAFLIDRRILLALAQESPLLTALIQGYIHASIHQIAQTAACNRLHSLEQRLCRWLLVARHGACADSFALTHEFFALMLGVQRSSVSIAADRLRKKGYIAYTRGRLSIHDEAGIRASACECYQAIRAHIEHVFTTRL